MRNVLCVPFYYYVPSLICLFALFCAFSFCFYVLNIHDPIGVKKYFMWCDPECGVSDDFVADDAL